MSANILDRFALMVAPRYGLTRLRARAAADHLLRHYEAAQGGRRTQGWTRNSFDANAVNRYALQVLRDNARDLVRNNPWAKAAQRVIANNVVGWGIVAKPRKDTAGTRALKQGAAAWKRWAESTDCDTAGRHDFYGLQRIVMKCLAEAGEVIVRRYWKTAEEANGGIPLSIQVLEPDYLDPFHDAYELKGAVGYALQGIEFDLRGKRLAYWLWKNHPGAQYILQRSSLIPERVPAEEVLHIYRMDRPGQIRGVSWYAPCILRMKDLDDFEDATLLRQKIAACFAAFVRDVDGMSSAVGGTDPEDGTLETIEPGMVNYLAPGRDVTFASPPPVQEAEPYTKSVLRGIAMGLGVTYEQLTGDFSNVNYSSYRAGRLEFQRNVVECQEDILIPHFCDPVWRWAMEAAVVGGIVGEVPQADWTPPAIPMLEPDKEGLAYMRNIRAGVQSLPEALREQGRDPESHLAEIAESNKALDDLGIILDSDPRKTTQVGNPRDRAPASGEGDTGNDKA